jgi:hypothetical protein
VIGSYRCSDEEDFVTHFRPRYQKTADDKVVVTLYQDLTLAWFVGTDQQGDVAYHPRPMGAFISERAARKWADAHFLGGTFSPLS